MNIPDHISESLETIFWVLKISDADPDLFDSGSGIQDEKIMIRNNHPGSATLKSTFFFIRERQEVAVQQVGEGGQKPGPAQPL